jgi:hypothetical protein
MMVFKSFISNGPALRLNRRPLPCVAKTRTGADDGLRTIAPPAGWGDLEPTDIHRRRQPVRRGRPTAPLLRLLARDARSPRRVVVVLRLRPVLAQVEALGRQWAPARLVPSGSFIELSRAELERVAAAADARVADVVTRLAQLEEAGFLPIVPAGGPQAAGSFERVGVVCARRLAARLHWTLPSGEELRGDAGDWHVIDGRGTARTVSDSEFRSSHVRLGDGRWQRVGVFRAWRVGEAVVLRTKEGSATARPGDWVVEGPGGERWPVSDGQFRRSYRPRQDRAATAGQASAPATISSSTAPTISQ